MASSGTEPCQSTWLCNQCRKSADQPVAQILYPHKTFPSAQFSTPTQQPSMSTVSTLPRQPSVSLISAPAMTSPQASRMLPNLSQECQSQLSNKDSMLYKGITIFKSSSSPAKTPTKSLTPSSSVLNSGPRIVNRTPTKSPSVTPHSSAHPPIYGGRIANGSNPAASPRIKTFSTPNRSATTPIRSTSAQQRLITPNRSVSSHSASSTPKSSQMLTPSKMSTSSQMSTQSNSDEEVLECFDAIPDTVIRNMPNVLRNGARLPNNFPSAVNGFLVQPTVNNDLVSRVRFTKSQTLTSTFL